MKKILFGSLVVIALGAYALWSTSQPNSTPTATNTNPSNTPPTTTNGTTNTGVYKDGTYTGAAANSIFGNVQVSATISGGKITDIQFLQYPKDRDNSLEISNHSMPILRSEAIAAQSAKVDSISGATQTWEAFQQTLSSALTAAQG